MNRQKELKSPVLSIFQDALRYIPSRIIPAAAGFAAIAVFTRFIDPKEYGYYILVATTIKIITTISVLWLNKACLRYFEEYRVKNELSSFISTCFSTFFILVLGIGVTFYLGSYFFGGYFDNYLLFLFRIGILAFFADSGLLLIMTILRANRQSLRYSTYSSLASTLRISIAVIMIVYFDIGPESIFWGTFIICGVLFLYETIKIFNVWRYRVSSVSKDIFKRMFNYGFPLIGQSIGMLVLSISDRYMIQYFMDASDVGIYSAGYNMIATIVDSLLNSLLLLAAFPIILKVFETKGKEKAGELLKEIITMYNAVLIPVIFGTAILSRDMASIFFGESFYQTYEIMPWVAAGLYFWGLTTYSVKSFELAEKTMKINYLVFWAGVSNIVLNIIFIPWFGALGAALATFFAYALCFLISVITGRKYLKISFPLKSMIKAVIASILMYLFILYVMPIGTGDVLYLLLNIFIGACIYLIALIILKEDALYRLLAKVKK